MGKPPKIPGSIYAAYSRSFLKQHRNKIVSKLLFACLFLHDLSTVYHLHIAKHPMHVTFYLLATAALKLYAS